MSITLIMAEFDKNRINCGKANLNDFNRLDPTLSSILSYFPDLKLVLYTDFDIKINFPNVETKIVKSIFDKNHSRYGNRCNDYYKILGLLEAKTEIAICMDSDMFICSKNIKTLLPMTKKFGICVPSNPRLLVKIDGIKGADGNYKIGEDESLGMGFAYNMSPIAFYTKNERARCLLKTYCKEMQINPARGPLVMWRAVWKTGIIPYLLPFQWCVCREHCAIKNEVVLHAGHNKVKEYYHITPIKYFSMGKSKSETK